MTVTFSGIGDACTRVDGIHTIIKSIEIIMWYLNGYVSRNKVRIRLTRLPRSSGLACRIYRLHVRSGIPSSLFTSLSVNATEGYHCVHQCHKAKAFINLVLRTLRKGRHTSDLHTDGKSGTPVSAVLKLL